MVGPVQKPSKGSHRRQPKDLFAKGDWMLQDLLYALRQLKRSPAFTALAILTLAVGMAAVTTVFTWANAVLFNPWPQVQRAGEIRSLAARIDAGGGYSLHYDQFLYVREHHQGFVDATAHEMFAVDLSGAGTRPERYWSGIVASNYFQMLGVVPIAGRGFTPHDDRAYGTAPEVVIGYDLWRSRFHGDPGMLGRTISVNRQPLTIVGIAPKNFVGIYGGMTQSLWLPFSELPALTDGKPDPLMNGYGLQAMARMRPGVSDQQASAELHNLAQQFAAQKNSTYYNKWDLLMSDPGHMSRGLYESISEVIPILFGAAGLLLVLVYANVAVLLIQRSSRRTRELAIRTSLGASPSRLLRQLLTETAVIAVLAGVTGWLASIALARTIYALLPKADISFAFNFRPDIRVLAFALGLTAITVLTCGLLPARQVLKFSQSAALHDGTTSVVGSRSRTRRNVLLSLQLALCFVVLVACGLLTRTLWNVVHRDPGFATDNTLVASMNLARAGYSEQQVLAFERTLLEHLRALPGVSSVSLTSYVPMGMSGGGNVRDIAIAGYQPAKDENMSIVVDSVGPDYFKTLHIPILEGREFNDRDVDTSPCVAVVNQTMARRYWTGNGGSNVLGSQIRVGKRSCEVVGVNRNIIYRSVTYDTGDPVVYLSILQDYQGGFSILMRGTASVQNLLPELDGEVSALDSALPINDIETLHDHVQTSYSDAKVPAEMIGVYGLCSLLVATLGVYAGLAYSVTERTKEFALRVALGAERKRIFSMVLGESGRIALGGMGVGAVGAFFALRVIKSLLYGVSPFDPFSAAGAVLLLVVTAGFAAWLPARRAASIEPMQALRSE
jgi:macrolide transport system ATP-binding/permease protein